MTLTRTTNHPTDLVINSIVLSQLFDDSDQNFLLFNLTDRVLNEKTVINVPNKLQF